ncbi:undecaprenyldiphospho-muramoylpentapeptide beta-N-acetylglucosaminyltransferase [Prosthecochloris sp. GSB1]|uniref:undecaprenyldiphospho-muramoylpentapeptide beta-N-acetylglucosaminyltransferase n=1 Tax=Prosthecochloris sp. GSB1 TaxID=281093 RepID=UPI000B8C759E|nr:undecaprenyldiphospho-muramoylpentapeptide beta-N-acetylglucosaminyltransferase [Prosthecochloris sp. GSB1]ASQ91500.1 undecaprenyldiphospho-muramoylpentapeptide beta-N-acetylglucosaminyltransferase [Prosthecochloris sp. GSB1]
MKVMFAGGGTGGHLYPAVAMAEELLERFPGTEVSFAGTENGIEATEIPRLGYRLHLFRVRGFLRGRRPADFAVNAGILAEFAGAVIAAARLIRTERPDVVVGTGGFVSAPLLLGAQLMGKKTLIQEQNAFPGVTTRMLSLRAAEVHLSFEESARILKRTAGVFLTGNPARTFPASPPGDARRTFGLDPERPTLLVFGGSRGARSINNAVKRWAADASGRANIIWQTGAVDFETVGRERRPSDSLWIGPYINDMASAYSAADLVLCRAGASTVAELTNLGKPAVLVPYPHATANHQFFNAEALVKQGAAELVEDKDVGDDRTRELVLGLLHDREALARIGAACRKQGRPEAAGALAERIAMLAKT